MRHYEFKLSFQTYRDLTQQELMNLENALTLQIQEPTNAEQEDEDYETKFINCTIQNFDVDDKCCQHDLDPDCDCCNAVCPDCQDDDYYLARKDK